MATAVASSGVARRSRIRLPERLPGLKGKWLTAYTIIALLLFVFAIVGNLSGTARRLTTGASDAYSWASIGLDISEGDDGLVVQKPNPIAQRNGIRAGDRVVAVGGVQVHSRGRIPVVLKRRLDEMLSLPDGSQVHLTVQSPGGRRKNVILVHARSQADLLYAGTGLTALSVTILCALAFLLAPSILIAAALLLFQRRADAVAALLSVSFLSFSCAGGVLGLTWFVDLDTVGVISAAFSIAAMCGFELALLVFPDGRFAPAWTAVIAMLIPPAGLATVIWPDSYVAGSTVLGILGVSVVALVVRYRRSRVDERQQWRWAMLGFSVGIALFTAWVLGYGAYLESNRGLSVDLWSFVLTPTVLSAAVLVIVGGVCLSVIRYRLYDSSAAVSRSAAYGVLTIGFVALFAGSEKLAEIIGERYFEHSIGMAAGAVGAAVAAAVVVPLHNRVHRWAERRFQKPLIRLREGLPDCVADLRDAASVGQIAEAVMNRVEAGVRSTREAVLLVDGGKRTISATNGVSMEKVEHWQKAWQPRSAHEALDCNRNDVTFPMRVRLCIETADQPETIGWLLLGPRPDGSFFGRDEREALAHVAGPVARAIHIAQLREAREQRSESRIQALESVVARLVERIRPKSGEAAPA